MKQKTSELGDLVELLHQIYTWVVVFNSCGVPSFVWADVIQEVLVLRVVVHNYLKPSCPLKDRMSNSKK